MSERTKEHGREISTAYFICGGRESTRYDFIASGKNAAELIYEDEQERRDFVRGWEQSWEENTLVAELLSEEDQIIAECTRIADRRVLVVERQTFHRARLCITGPPPCHPLSYETTYDYATPDGALKAFLNWQDNGPEPDGWQRHHGTGRYRIDGKRELEWVKDQNGWTLEQNIRYAIQVTKGKDKSIGNIIESSEHIGSEMPIGTKCYIVASEGVHTWNAYHRWDRSLVLTVGEMESVSVSSVIERLKGD